MPRPLRVCLSGLHSSEPGSERDLPLDVARYVTRVHRLGTGAGLVLFDPESGMEASAVVRAAGKRVVCEILGLQRGSRPGLPGLALVLAQPKAAALEETVRAAVALSVARITLVDSEHAVPREPGTRAVARQQRLRAVALDSARQCLRSDLPAIDGPLSLQGLASELERDTGRWSGAVHCVLDPRGDGASLARALRELAPRLDQLPGLCLWVGPEGGFSDREIMHLSSKGVRRVQLGRLVLRVPTAVTAALGALIARHWDDGSNSTSHGP